MENKIEDSILVLAFEDFRTTLVGCNTRIEVLFLDFGYILLCVLFMIKTNDVLLKPVVVGNLIWSMRYLIELLYYQQDVLNT